MFYKLGGARGAGRECYPFRKMIKSQEQYPYLNKILHNYHLIFFYMIDIQIFTYRGVKGAGKLQPGGIIHSDFRTMRKPQEQYPF